MSNPTKIHSLSTLNDAERSAVLEVLDLAGEEGLIAAEAAPEFDHNAPDLLAELLKGRPE